MRKQERGGSSTTSSSRREERYTGRKEGRDVYRGRDRVEEAVPKPIGSMCSPICPLFKCSRRALIINLVSGKPSPYCSWVNDNCIGYKCQYSICTARYLLPDGKCLYAVKTEPKSGDEFIKELESKEDSTSLKSLLSRRGIRKYLGAEDF